MSLATSAEPWGKDWDRRRLEIEAWFRRRGVPQLIQDYTAERQMDYRAAPYLVAWVLVGTIAWWGTRPDWSFWQNAGGVAITIVTVAVALAAIQWIARRKPWWTTRRLDAAEVFVVGALVGVVSGIIERSPIDGLADSARVLTGIAVIYLVVGLGLGAIGLWSVRQLREELSHIAGLVARTLPVLLILVLFLVFAAELWEAAHHLEASEMAAVIVLLVLVAGTLVTTSFRAELPSIEAAPWDVVSARLEGTPAHGILRTIPAVTPPRLRPLQRLNLGALALLGQLIQSAFVALMVAAFLVVFGLIALPGDLVERWVGSPVTEVAVFDWFGEPRLLSRELVMVSILLGSVVGLYFTGLAMTDSAYRTAHFDRMLEEVRQLVAVRDAYLVTLFPEDLT